MYLLFGNRSILGMKERADGKERTRGRMSTSRSETRDGGSEGKKWNKPVVRTIEVGGEKAKAPVVCETRIYYMLGPS
jgi:hypothetical protein